MYLTVYVFIKMHGGHNLLIDRSSDSQQKRNGQDKCQHPGEHSGWKGPQDEAEMKIIQSESTKGFTR